MIYHHARSLVLLIIFSVFQISQEQGDMCTGVTCNNKGTCVPNSAYSRGYWCECDDGWAGQDCKHPEPSVQCGDDRIDVVIDKGLVRELGIDDDAKYVYFGKSSATKQCRAIEQDNLYQLSIKAPFSNCGTQVIVRLTSQLRGYIFAQQRAAGDDYTFSNTVVWNSDVRSQQNLIDRKLVLLDFKCIYEDSYTVSGPPILPTLNVLRFVTETGKFEVRMRLFDDSSYSAESEYTQAPTIAIGTYVFVQVLLSFAKDSNLVVTLDRCFASQSRDPGDPISTKHSLIMDRCASLNDTTIGIELNGEAAEARFKFQMFKWRWSADDVYLHCEVDICNRTQEVCTGDDSNCKGTAQTRQRRDLLTHEGIYDSTYVPNPGHILTQGPLQVFWEEAAPNAGRSAEDNKIDFSLLALGLACGLMLLLLGVVIAVSMRKLKRSKNQSTTDNQRTLTSLRFSTESF